MPRLCTICFALVACLLSNEVLRPPLQPPRASFFCIRCSCVYCPEPLHLSILKTKSIYLEHRYRTYVRRVRIRKSKTWSALGWIRPSFRPSVLSYPSPAQLIPKNRIIASFAGTWYRAAGLLSFFLSFLLSFFPSFSSIYRSIHPSASTYAYNTSF